MAITDDVNKLGDNANKHDDIGTSSELTMSFGDTLYLHPNDTSGSSIVTINLTSTENYKIDDKNLAFANQWDMCNSVVVTWILNSLSHDLFADESYLAIRSNILNREPLPLVKAAFAVVSGEESHRNATSVGATKPTATAFVAKTFDNKRRFNNNNNRGSGSNTNFNNRGPNPNLKCTNFYKIGHTVDKCFELVGYPAGYMRKNFNANTRHVSSNDAFVSVDVHSNNVSSNNATTSNSHVSLSNEQLARLMSLLNDNGVSTANANMADVWGPYKVINRDGFRYFFTVVDDFSRAVWVYTLKRKDDVYDSIGNGNSEATSIEEFKSEVKNLPVNTVRRVVNYANLSHENFCFDSSLNKSVESTCYRDVILNNNWTDTMNAEIEALNKNHTWIITDLSANRNLLAANGYLRLNIEKMEK
ncbi:ribonuclease H-like domain-containing protein [Tanacetum coccineum]